MSHGAVIAREYGLPCLVGVSNATLHFATGDIVLLDAKAGFVTKLDAFESFKSPEECGSGGGGGNTANSQ